LCVCVCVCVRVRVRVCVGVCDVCRLFYLVNVYTLMGINIDGY
jgi:hypothetical protein